MMSRSFLLLSNHHTRRHCFFSTVALSLEETKEALRRLSEQTTAPWHEVPGHHAMTKVFEFTDFNQAWSFLSRTALLAEKMNHHPEWSNVYNRVEVTLTTHDCGGVSNKDIQMAQHMEEYARELLPFRKYVVPSTTTS